jgi:hypothetical protein
MAHPMVSFGLVVIARLVLAGGLLAILAAAVRRR